MNRFLLLGLIVSLSVSAADKVTISEKHEVEVEIQNGRPVDGGSAPRLRAEDCEKYVDSRATIRFRAGAWYALGGPINYVTTVSLHQDGSVHYTTNYGVNDSAGFNPNTRTVVSQSSSYKDHEGYNHSTSQSVVTQMIQKLTKTSNHTSNLDKNLKDVLDCAILKAEAYLARPELPEEQPEVKIHRSYHRD